MLHNYIKYLENEINIYLTLPTHIRIAKYLGCCILCEDVGKHFFAIFLENASNGSIRENLRFKSEGFDEYTVKKYTQQVIQGIDFLHNHFIVHFDIKGANVVIDISDSIKIIDFGSAERLNSKSDSIRKKGAGTVKFMAPEVMMGEDCNYKSDIWSIGCTVVEMLTCQPPWCNLKPFQINYKVINGEYPSYTLPAQSSDDVKEFLRICFHRDLKSRPTADELLTLNFFNRT